MCFVTFSQAGTSVVRTHAKLQVILSINSVFRSHLKLTCQSIFFIWNIVLKGLKAKKFVNNCQKCIRGPFFEFWVGEFKRGRTRLEDDPREGRPKTAITSEIIEQVHNIVSEDPSLTKHEIVNAIGISDERKIKKLFGKLVPHTLTI